MLTSEVETNIKYFSHKIVEYFSFLNTMRIKQNNKKILLGVLGSLSLGLAPFTPEPHLFGKIRWVAGGAVGMTGMDWFDLVLHSAPWLFLAYALVERIRLSRTIKNEIQD